MSSVLGVLGPSVSIVLESDRRPDESRELLAPSSNCSGVGGSRRGRVRAGAPTASEFSASRRPRTLGAEHASFLDESSLWSHRVIELR